MNTFQLAGPFITTTVSRFIIEMAQASFVETQKDDNCQCRLHLQMGIVKVGIVKVGINLLKPVKTQKLQTESKFTNIVTQHSYCRKFSHLANVYMHMTCTVAKVFLEC